MVKAMVRHIYGGRIVSGFGIDVISTISANPPPTCANARQVDDDDDANTNAWTLQIMVAVGVMLSYFINCMLKQISAHSQTRMFDIILCHHRLLSPDQPL
jgi:hypothetical protein